MSLFFFLSRRPLACQWRRSHQQGLFSKRQCVVTIPQHQSSFSTTTKTTKSARQSKISLYERQPNRLLLPRAVLGSTSFFTLYWTWYVIDFIPFANQTNNMQIDARIGYLGLFLGLIIQSAAIIFPLRLVSNISYQQQQQSSLSTSENNDNNNENISSLQIATHGIFPFIRAPPPTIMERPLGHVTLDTSTIEGQRFISDPVNFRGYVTLRSRKEWLPLFVDVQANEVKHGPDLLQVLIKPNDINNRKTQMPAKKRQREKLRKSSPRQQRKRQ